MTESIKESVAGAVKVVGTYDPDAVMPLLDNLAEPDCNEVHAFLSWCVARQVWERGGPSLNSFIFLYNTWKESAAH